MTQKRRVDEGGEISPNQLSWGHSGEESHASQPHGSEESEISGAL